MKCVARTYFAWTTFCSNQQNPGAATLRDGSFGRWDVDTKGFPRDGKCTMLIYFPASLRARRFEKPTDVGPIVRNGSRSPQWWGARWRKQDTVHKSFVNSTEVVFAAVPPCSTIEVTCNQVNFLRNHDGTESEDELLGNAFLVGIDVADMKRQHCKVLLPAYWLTPKHGT